MNFGAKVKELRKSKGITQEELAQRIGLTSKSTICKIERGQRMTPIPVVSKIAAALGVSVAELLEEPAPVNPVEEFVPYLIKAEEWQLDAGRRILAMPEKKSVSDSSRKIS